MIYCTYGLLLDEYYSAYEEEAPTNLKLTVRIFHQSLSFFVVRA